MKRKEMARRLRLAAEYIFSSHRRRFSCPAVGNYCGDEFMDLYELTFCPDDAYNRDKNYVFRIYWLDLSNEAPSTIELKKTWRVWALCFAAAMAETGDL